jgi:hypothetical protein
MISPRLYNFFMLDDSARWRAIAWSVAIGGVCGFGSSGLLSVAGSVAVTTLCSIGTLAVIVAGYSQERYRRVVFEHGRLALKRSLIATAEVAFVGLVVALIGKTSSAIAYAQSATDAIRAGTPISAIRIVIAKRVIRKGLRSGQENQPGLLRAYAQLSAAERYYRVKEETAEKVAGKISRGSTAALKIDKAITLKGRGRTRTLITIQPMGSIFIISSPAFTLEDIGFQTVAAPAPKIFRFIGKPDVVVKGCSFKGFHPVLDGITWVDVDFQDCVIDSDLMDLTLVNVTFTNCTLPDQLARLSSPVTFSSSGVALGRQ